MDLKETFAETSGRFKKVLSTVDHVREQARSLRHASLEYDL